MSLRQKIIQRVQPDLDGIEAALRENLGAQLDIVTEAAGHILFGGGKRLRPLLMVLCARLCDYAGDRDRYFSTVFEYLHVATLLHDDLVDGASLRRGRPVAHSIWGNAIAVLVGDFLLARSLTIGSHTGKLPVIEVISRITEGMSQGEIHQLTQKGNLELSEAEYLEVIRRKTAVLIQGACQVGAMIADAPTEAESALARYGLHLGLAFQMADDLLDYTADSQTLGKAVGADLREGKITLPLIHTLNTASTSDRSYLENMIRAQRFSPDQFARLLGILEGYGGIAYTRQAAFDHLQKAKQALEGFPRSETREILSYIADYTLSRNR